jgi:hypothetical protein
MTGKRICVEVDLALYKRFNDNIQWGFRRHLLKALLSMVVDAIEKDPMMVGALYANEYKIVRTDQSD